MYITMKILLFSTVIFLGLLCLNGVNAGDDGDCKVCNDILGKFIDSLTDDERSNLDTVEAKLMEFCEKQKPGTEGRRLCYSVETVKREACKPISQGLPAEAVCKRLARRDGEICKIKEVKKLDLRTINPSKLRVKELKGILSDHDLFCKGCTDKAQYVAMVQKEIIDKLPPKEDL